MFDVLFSFVLIYFCMSKYLHFHFLRIENKCTMNNMQNRKEADNRKENISSFISIRLRVGLSYLLIILVPFLIVGIAANSYMRNSALDRETKTLLNSIISTELYVNEILGTAEQYYYLFTTNEGLIKSAQTIVNPDNIDTFANLKNIAKIYNSMKNYVYNAAYVNSIYFYNTSTEAFYLSSKEDFHKRITTKLSDDIAFNLNRKDIEQSRWYLDYRLQNTNQVWYLTRNIKPENSHMPLLAFCASLKFGRDDSAAVISINIEEREIKDVLATISANDKTVISIFNSNSQIISSTDDELLHKIAEDTQYEKFYSTVLENSSSASSEEIINGKKHLLLGYYSPEYDWVYIVQTPYDAVVQSALQSRNILILLYVIISVLVIISLIFTIPLFYTPLEKLIGGMKKIETGDFDIRLPERRGDEYGYIFKQFNKTVSSIQLLIKENYSIAIEKNSITMKYIQSQINKHFLFNTLNIINWKVREGDTDLGADAIVTLSNFFRLSLNYGEDFLSVEEVCSMLGYYGELIELRYPKKYDIKINYDSPILHEPVLKIIFQPLLENSLQHGFGKEQGRIDIDFKQKNGGILFVLTDNGVGMSNEQVRSIIKSFKDPVHKQENFALKSINRLLQLVHKDNYSFKIKSTPGYGTTIEIFMPAHKEGLNN
jgi:two-component system, sensor histidine kinase YesM